MKSLFSFSILSAWLLVGCGEKSSQPATTTNAPAASSGSVLTAPVDYLNSVVKQQKEATKTIDTTSLNKAIDMFQVQEGRLPKDLDELVAKKYIPLIPIPPVGTKLVYNATKGTVSVEKQ
jgi:hypothetical protein